MENWKNWVDSSYFLPGMFVVATAVTMTPARYCIHMQHKGIVLLFFVHEKERSTAAAQECRFLFVARFRCDGFLRTHGLTEDESNQRRKCDHHVCPSSQSSRTINTTYSRKRSFENSPEWRQSLALVSCSPLYVRFLVGRSYGQFPIL